MLLVFFLARDKQCRAMVIEQHWESLTKLVGRMKALSGARGSLWFPVIPFYSWGLPLGPSHSISVPVPPFPSQLEQSPVVLSEPKVVLEEIQTGASELLLPTLEFCAACRTSVWPFKHVSSPLETGSDLKQCLFTKKNPGSKHREKAFRSMLLPRGAQTFCTNSGANTVIFY